MKMTKPQRYITMVAACVLFIILTYLLVTYTNVVYTVPIDRYFNYVR